MEHTIPERISAVQVFSNAREVSSPGAAEHRPTTQSLNGAVVESFEAKVVLVRYAVAPTLTTYKRKFVAEVKFTARLVLDRTAVVQGRTIRVHIYVAVAGFNEGLETTVVCPAVARTPTMS